MALEINTQNLEGLMESDKLLVVDFWAEWCGPCRTLSPIIDALAADYADKASIGKCDVEENNDIVVEYSIRNVPTVLFIKKGMVIERISAAVGRSALVEILEKHL